MTTNSMKTVACTAILALSGLLNSASADPTAPIPRLFLVLSDRSSTAETYDQIPGLVLVDDLLNRPFLFGDSEASLDYTDDDFRAYDDEGNLLIDAEDTTWTRHRTLHASRDGDGFLDRNIYFLSEDLDGDGAPDVPPPGALVRTGPHGDVALIASLYTRLIFNAGDYNEGKWLLRTIPNSADFRIDIYIGLFNK